MSNVSRRNLIRTGLVATAGVSGLAAAAGMARRYGLVPPDASGLYAPGETLTYAAQRILTAHSHAREFARSEISKTPFPNPVGRVPEVNDWHLAVDGLIARPGSFSVADLKTFPQRSQITHLACEEGWSYIAEWTGVPLSHILDLVGTLPQARYVVYRSLERGWWDSIDMADALHMQTILTLGMNGSDLPVAFGGPLRMRVPRQLGYKSVKFINHLTVTDSMKGFGKGLGGAAPEAGYAWYAGI